MMHVVLVEPEIPGNTGNIARLCAATGASLHLVRPLGFSVDDRYLKRAGLDYWHLVDIHYYDSVEEVLAAYPDSPRFLLTTHAHKSYSRVHYGPDLRQGKRRSPGKLPAGPCRGMCADPHGQ